MPRSLSLPRNWRFLTCVWIQCWELPLFVRCSNKSKLFHSRHGDSRMRELQQILSQKENRDPSQSFLLTDCTSSYVSTWLIKIKIIQVHWRASILSSSSFPTLHVSVVLWSLSLNDCNDTASLLCFVSCARISELCCCSWERGTEKAVIWADWVSQCWLGTCSARLQLHALSPVENQSAVKPQTHKCTRRS